MIFKGGSGSVVTEGGETNLAGGEPQTGFAWKESKDLLEKNQNICLRRIKRFALEESKDLLEKNQRI